MTNEHELIAPRMIRPVRASEGERFDVAGVKFNWKAKGEDTQEAFTIVEQVLVTRDGVPPHSHPYTEFFYVLQGVVVFRQFLRTDDALSQVFEVSCGVGDAVIVPPGAIHAFDNSEEPPARILGVSNYKHQQFFDGVQHADQAEPFGAMPPEKAMEKVAFIGRQHSMFFESP